MYVYIYIYIYEYIILYHNIFYLFISYQNHTIAQYIIRVPGGIDVILAPLGYAQFCWAGLMSFRGCHIYIYIYDIYIYMYIYNVCMCVHIYIHIDNIKYIHRYI